MTANSATPYGDPVQDSRGQDGDAQTNSAENRDFSTMSCEQNVELTPPESSTSNSKSIIRYTQDTPTEREDCTIESNDLCAGCLSLNLPGLLRTSLEPEESERQYPAPWSVVSPADRKKKYVEAKVGFRYRKSRAAACMLCQMLIASRLESVKKDGNEEVGDHSQAEVIVALPFDRRTYLFHQRDSEVVCLILITGSLHKHLYYRYRHHVLSRGCAVLLRNTMDPTLFIPQPIPRAFNPHTAKLWLGYCKDHHRSLCASEPLPVHDVEVIDCLTLLVEKCDANTPYIALSYVWGTAGDTCALREFDGKRALPQNLSPVIRDSIEVTKALGYRYLWIDRYCIKQDAPDVKHDQIRQMNAIYQNSELTIISAAGSDENYGLPGVGIRNRSRQPVVKLHDATVMWLPKNPHWSISRSHWWTRGWTFQEALLSRRRLVFTHEQIYFECGTMSCFESLQCPLDMLHAENRSEPRRYLRSGIFGRIFHGRPFQPNKLNDDNLTFQDAFWAYMSNVIEYTKRNLRFDEDAINAFQGLLQKFSEKQFSLDNIWGLCYPQISTDRANHFAWLLTWAHIDKGPKRPRRRVMFPSWTWAGWEGQAVYNRWPRSRGKFQNGLQKICFRSEDGALTSFEDIAPAIRYPVLRVIALTISITSDAYQLTANDAYRWRILEQKATLWWSADSQTYDAFLETFAHTERWQVIWVATCAARFSFFMVLESLPETKTWQRVGMFRTKPFREPLERLLEEGLFRTFEIV